LCRDDAPLAWLAQAAKEWAARLRKAARVACCGAPPDGDIDPSMHQSIINRTARGSNELYEQAFRKLLRFRRNVSSVSAVLISQWRRTP
jgi:hypothetical protein